MTARLFSCVMANVLSTVLVHTTLVWPAAAQSVPAAAPVPVSVRNVLAIYWSSEDFPSTTVLEAAVRHTLRSAGDIPVDYFAEYLESDRFSPDVAFESLRDYIQQKYRDRHIDVVIAVAEPALEFAIRYRATLFPDAPIVVSVNAAPSASLRAERSGITGLVSSPGDALTLQLALRLHPSTRRVFVVAYAPTVSFAERIGSLRTAAHGVDLSAFEEPSLERLLEAVRRVPERSLILYLRHSREDPGRVLFPTDVARLVSEAAPVPVYAITDSAIGAGVVGGVVRKRNHMGRRLAEMVKEILAGARAQDIPVESVHLVPTFDWRQIRKWGVDPASLPPGSEILFRQPTLWELYRWYFVGASTLLLAQSALIGGLLAQRKKRRRVEAALRESEAHFRVMADSAPVMIWKSDTQGKYDFVNTPVLRFSGRTLEEELGDGWSQVIHADDRANCLNTFAKAVRERDTFRMEYRARRCDGQYRWMFATGVPRWDSDGVFAGHIGSCLDITDRRQAEQALQETHRELSRLSRLIALGEYAASISHELRQPLTAIALNARSCLRILSAQRPDLEELKAGLLDVTTASQRADQMITRNRELFRSHAVEIAPMDLNVVVQEAVALIATRLADNGISLEMELGDDLPAVLGDRIELQQVLLNLLTNAIEAMERVDARSRRLRISSFRGADHNVTVTIADTGVGLRDVDMSRLFELSYTTKATGTGVGLSISRSIVEAHGGTVWARPNADNGATFGFEVPAVPAVVTDGVEPVLAAQGAPPHRA
jgi:PAS domain S-box-containing protein